MTIKKLHKQLSIYTPYKFAYNHFKLTIIRAVTNVLNFLRTLQDLKVIICKGFIKRQNSMKSAQAQQESTDNTLKVQILNKVWDITQSNLSICNKKVNLLVLD